MPMLPSLGLGGDGDEVEASEGVEREFGLAFAAADAERFVTVGDVWTALRAGMRLDDESAEPLWPRFAAAIGSVTDADPARIDKATRLLAEPLGQVLKRAIRRLAGRR